MSTFDRSDPNDMFPAPDQITARFRAITGALSREPVDLIALTSTQSTTLRRLLVGPHPSVAKRDVVSVAMDRLEVLAALRRNFVFVSRTDASHLRIMARVEKDIEDILDLIERVAVG